MDLLKWNGKDEGGGRGVEGVITLPFDVER